jgi:protein TonB
MNHHWRIASAFAGAAIMLPLGPVTAHPDEASMGTVAFVPWAQRISGTIGDQLYYPRPMFGREFSNGIVQVKFGCSESGAPSDVSIYRSSKDRRLDSEALKAVRKIASLHPLPRGFSSHQHYVAVIIFADGDASMKRQMKAVRKDAEQRNAWMTRSGSSTAIAMSMYPLPAG